MLALDFISAKNTTVWFLKIGNNDAGDYIKYQNAQEFIRFVITSYSSVWLRFVDVIIYYKIFKKTLKKMFLYTFQY